MRIEAKNVDEYLTKLPEDRQVIMKKLRNTFKSYLPKGFEENFQYNMMSYVIPLSLYPKGYLNKKDTPLPIISVASQKNHIAIYHMGVYMTKEVMDWFVAEYQKRVPHKLDMGKSCIRFKKMDEIPYDLIQELATKITPHDFIQLYEKYQ
jgi:uncharacterized protein YdhG (YjbR/CyaY superfamily)